MGSIRNKLTRSKSMIFVGLLCLNSAAYAACDFDPVVPCASSGEGGIALCCDNKTCHPEDRPKDFCKQTGLGSCLPVGYKYKSGEKKNCPKK